MPNLKLRARWDTLKAQEKLRKTLRTNIVDSHSNVSWKINNGA
jgi:hypothetical protein